MLKFELHPEAAKNYNIKAEGLIPKVSVKDKKTSRLPFIPDIHTANVPRKDIIGEMIVSCEDQMGNVKMRAIDEGTHQWGYLMRAINR